jgi:hypothetical protein
MENLEKSENTLMCRKFEIAIYFFLFNYSTTRAMANNIKCASVIPKKSSTSPKYYLKYFPQFT